MTDRCGRAIGLDFETWMRSGHVRMGHMVQCLFDTRHFLPVCVDDARPQPNLPICQWSSSHFTTNVHWDTRNLSATPI